MKLFSFILSIYVLALAIVPCADGIIDNAMDSENIELSESEHAHDHSNHSDDCTPLCTCTCCGSVVSAPVSQIVESPFIIFITSYQFSYDGEYSLQYNKGIWHPPTTC